MPASAARRARQPVRAGNPKRMAALRPSLGRRRGLNLLEIDVKDENGEVVGFLGGAPGAAPSRTHAAARLLRPAGRRAPGARAAASTSSAASSASRIRSSPSTTRRSRSARAAAASGTNTDGVGWAQPVQPAATGRYLISLAKAAARAGVDEIQFDYVRFPSDGDRLSTMRFAGKRKEPIQRDVIPHFLTVARRARSRRSTSSSASTSSASRPTHDLGIGQDVSLIGKHVDVISPMLYPIALQRRRARPQRSQRRPEPDRRALDGRRSARSSLGSPNAKIRPWLQDFGWRTGYTIAEVRAQINAAIEQGASGWMLWNAADGVQQGRVRQTSADTFRAASAKLPAWQPLTDIDAAVPARRRDRLRHRRDEVRRLVRGRRREGARRRAAPRRGQARRPARRRHRLGDGQDDRLADRARARGLARARRARDGHAALDRRAHLVRAGRDGDPRPRLRGRLVHRQPGRHRHRRRRTTKREDPSRSARSACSRRSTRARSCSSPASRASRPTPTT